MGNVLSAALAQCWYAGWARPSQRRETLELVIAHKATKSVHCETARQIRDRIDLKAKAKGAGLEALVDQLLSGPKTPSLAQNQLP